MKKIIFSSHDNYDSNHRGGTAIAVHEVARRLTHAYDVTVLAAHDAGCADRIIDGVRYRHIGFRRGEMRFKQAVYLLLLPLFVLLSDYVIWIEAFTGPFSCMALQLFTRRPVIGATHLLNGKEIKEKYGGVPFDIIERAFLKTYRFIAALTPAQAQAVKVINPAARIEEIPNGIDPRLLEVRHKGGRGIVYIGRIDIFQKGIDMLLESYEHMHTRPPFCIAGFGSKEEEKKVAGIIKTKGLSTVEMPGFVSFEEKCALLSEADVFVHGSRFETFGISVLEAMAAGVPCVLFDIEGFAWIPDDCIVKVPAFDTTAMGKAIETVLSDTILQGRLSSAGRAFAATYTWDAIAKKYDDYITSLLPCV